MSWEGDLTGQSGAVGVSRDCPQRLLKLTFFTLLGGFLLQLGFVLLLGEFDRSDRNARKRGPIQGDVIWELILPSLLPLLPHG
jgi:hypothetical protein